MKTTWSLASEQLSFPITTCTRRAIGSSRIRQELLQPWADQARRIGISDFALTDHDRYHAGVDFDEIDRFRENNPDLKIRAGIELDNDPVHSAAGRAWVEKNWERLDFVLGSVHFLERADQMFDTVPAGAEQFAGAISTRSTRIISSAFATMAATGLVDCLSHLDLVKIHGHRPQAKIRNSDRSDPRPHPRLAVSAWNFRPRAGENR